MTSRQEGMPSCSLCSSVLGDTVYEIAMNRGLCEPCATAIEKCPHETGDQAQRYDADGCGYRVWVCFACGAETLDPY